MKTFVNRMFLFAAGAVVLGTMAYGQTQMTAKIPFAFRTTAGTLPAGTYSVNQLPGSGFNGGIKLWNTDSHQTALVMGAPRDSYSLPTRSAMVFACGNEGCALSAIKTTAGTYHYAAPRRSKRDKETLSMISIPVVAVQGE
jgi:hypothetical protein